jgi:hypothetical protein
MSSITAHFVVPTQQLLQDAHSLSSALTPLWSQFGFWWASDVDSVIHTDDSISLRFQTFTLMDLEGQRVNALWQPFCRGVVAWWRAHSDKDTRTIVRQCRGIRRFEIPSHMRMTLWSSAGFQDESAEKRDCAIKSGQRGASSRYAWKFALEYLWIRDTR